MTDMTGKSDGFRDEKYMIIPTESFEEYITTEEYCPSLYVICHFIPFILMLFLLQITK